jgi:hypothetical protein
MTEHNPTNDAPRPYLLQPGEGVPGFDASVKAARRSTGGLLTIIESESVSAKSFILTPQSPLHDMERGS